MNFRYKATVEYDGTMFHGWQSQQHLSSVQGSIRNAIFHFVKKDVVVYGAGRTDAGVHALGQVIHFDVDTELDCNKFRHSLNHVLRNCGVVILSLEKADHSFHARFSALSKTYLYKIINRNSDLTVLKNRAWLVRGALDVNLINEAISAFIGRHDFKYFRYSKCQSQSSLKTLQDVKLSYIIDQNQTEINISFTAISFLHKQIRMMVGAACNVALNKMNLLDIKNALCLKSSLPMPLTAPAHGLYLKFVEY